MKLNFGTVCALCMRCINLATNNNTSIQRVKLQWRPVYDPVYSMNFDSNLTQQAVDANH